MLKINISNCKNILLILTYSTSLSNIIFFVVNDPRLIFNNLYQSEEY